MSNLPYLRTSERGTFNECVQKWWWSYREGLKPNMVKADALWFGTGMHLALAEYYPAGTKRGINPVETWLEYCGQTRAWIRDNSHTDPDTPDLIEAKELGQVMLEGYLQRWGADEHWDVIQPEYRFHVLVGRPTPMLSYVGTFDGVYRDLRDGKIKLMEHKTRGRTITTKHLRLDNQAGGYWAIASHELRHQGLIGPKESIWDIEYNFLRKGMPDERPKNELGQATNRPTKKHYIDVLTGVDGWTVPELTKMKLDELDGIAVAHMWQVYGDVSKSQPAPLFVRYPLRRTAAERNSQLQRIQDDMQHMNAVRSRALPVTKSPGDHCNFCPFVEMCELHEAGGDWKQYRKFAYHVEDPYADHRPGVEVSSKFVLGRER